MPTKATKTSKKAKTEAKPTEDDFPSFENFHKHFSKGKQNLKKLYNILKDGYRSNEERIDSSQEIIDNDNFKSLHRGEKKYQKSLMKENKNILGFVEKNSSEKEKSTEKSPEMLYKHSTNTFFAEKSDPQHWNNQSDEEKSKWESLSQLWNDEKQEKKLSIVSEKKVTGKPNAMKVWINENLSSTSKSSKKSSEKKKSVPKAKKGKKKATNASS